MQVFRIWCKAVRGSKVARCKAALEKNLFILNPVFQGALHDFNGLCCALESQSLLKEVGNKPVKYSDFLAEQLEHVERCKESLEETAIAALACVRNACKESLAALERELAEVWIAHAYLRITPQLLLQVLFVSHSRLGHACLLYACL
jgi:hypothetical protein